MEWTVEHDGEYRARFTPTEDGLYKVAVGGTTKDGKDVGRGDGEHARGAERRRVLRRRDARAAAQAHRRGNRRPVLHGRRRHGALVDAITYSGKGITVVEDRELWDMPIVLLLLLGLDGRRVAVPAVARAGVDGRRTKADAHDATRCVRVVARGRWRSPAPRRRSRSAAAAQRPQSQSYTGNVRVRRPVHVRAHELSVDRRPPAAPWAHDYPRGEEHFLKILHASSRNVPSHIDESSIMAFSDPEMFKFPVIYLAEPGYWSMTDAGRQEPARLPAQGRLPDRRRLPRQRTGATSSCR